MTPHEVVFSRNADEDLDAISDYIAKDSPNRALSFVFEPRSRTIALLTTSPNIGTAEGKHRHVVFGRYIVAYRVDDDISRVTVVLVTEGHRDWRRLLEGLG